MAKSICFWCKRSTVLLLLQLIMKKSCTKCGISKDLSYFCIDRSTKTGYTSQCKVCRVIYTNLWKVANTDKVRDINKRYVTKRLKEDVEYNILHKLRVRTKNAIKNQYGSKAYSTIELLGCSIHETRSHIETQFSNGMTWDNYGEWHIDHIKPCSSFDLTDPSQQKKCFNYKNLQPLWAKDNFKKSNNY